MLVTPINKSFGRYKPGENFELPDKSAKVLILAKILRAADDGEEISPRTGLPKRAYKRRDMRAES